MRQLQDICRWPLPTLFSTSTRGADFSLLVWVLLSVAPFFVEPFSEAPYSRPSHSSSCENSKAFGQWAMFSDLLAVTWHGTISTGWTECFACRVQSGDMQDSEGWASLLFWDGAIVTTKQTNLRYGLQADRHGRQWLLANNTAPSTIEHH